MSGLLQQEAELIVLPAGTVIAGPAWHDEIYQKGGTDEWYAVAQETPWTSRSLLPRGPFTILREARS